jgi:CHAT domain-containing protein/tetratricopeptide (TPR) repeat protein
MRAICCFLLFRIWNIDMRALLIILALLSPLFVGCDRPSPEDYSTDPQTVAGAGGGQAGPGTYERLMADGARANFAGRSDDALPMFRQALRLAEARFGKGRPDTALPIMSLALMLSNEGQFTEADSRFAEADLVLRSSKDQGMKARLSHYRGMHLLNQGKAREAEAELGAAQTAYMALLPEDALTRDPVADLPRSSFDVSGIGRVAATISLQNTATDPATQPVLLGLIETMRYRAITMRRLGRPEDASKLIASASRIASGNGVARASVNARLYRTAGLIATASSLPDRALDSLYRSDGAFQVALPETKPAAETKLLHAGELMREGKAGAALTVCRRAVRTLIAISAGTTPELMAPCLDAYASGGLFDSRHGNFAEMFMAAQIAQGTITSHQIAQASAALAENARDPEIGKALKLRDSLQREADRIYRAVDTLGGGAVSDRTAGQIAQLEQEGDQVQAQLAQAEARVRQLSPNYGQLVQDVVPARDVFAVMHSDEAFVALFLSQHEGWTFALRNGEIAISRIEGGTDTIGPLVKRVRSGMDGAAGAFDIESAKRLYDLTLRGVAPLMQGAHAFVIAPTGPLLSIPFSILVTGPADPNRLAEVPWLLRQGTISHVPAPTNFISLRKVADTSRAPKKWFGFGDFRKPDPARIQAGFPDRQCARDRAALAGLPLLPGATAELKGAEGVLGTPQTDALLGDAFTADRVASQDLKPYQILHFAAHALLPSDLECQTEAAIVTSPPPSGTNRNSWLLTASRVLNLDLDANLVILSACNSGGGDGKSGESLSGLARSFFFAHARSLLVTHWDVNDKVAALLVVLTINNLKEKPMLGVAGALREAQLELLDQSTIGKYPAVIAHPFYWAPFAVIGDGGGRAGRSALSAAR